jgi:hypothetical protein
MGRLIESTEVKTVLLFRFLNFHSIIQHEIEKNVGGEFTTPVMGANIT